MTHCWLSYGHRMLLTVLLQGVQVGWLTRGWWVHRGYMSCHGDMCDDEAIIHTASLGDKPELRSFGITTSDHRDLLYSAIWGRSLRLMCN